MGRSRYDHNDDDNEFEFEKDLEIKVDADIELDFDVDVDVKKETDIDIKVESDIKLDGNSAEMNLDLQALGDDSHVQADLVILTTENISSITGYLGSFVDG